MVQSVEDGTDPLGRADTARPKGEAVAVSPTVRVPLSPDGVATAITHAASACPTTGPERSDPSNRDHPPLLTFGEERVPTRVTERTPETGIELRVPADYGALYATAPLAYYLGASVEPIFLQVAPNPLVVVRRDPRPAGVVADEHALVAVRRVLVGFGGRRPVGVEPLPLRVVSPPSGWKQTDRDGTGVRRHEQRGGHENHESDGQEGVRVHTSAGSPLLLLA